MAALFNRTPGVVELVPLIDRHGANVMAVICKVTYDIGGGGVPAIAPDQEPLEFVDITSPSGDELVRASDITDFKPSTDVVLTAPDGPVDAHPAAGHEIEVEIGPVRVRGKVAVPWRFGPVPRARTPRRAYAGTYNQAWLDERCPLLPPDFDPRHNQVAPPSQVSPRPFVGDEPVTIRNLYTRGQVLHGQLPGCTAVVAGNIRGHYFTEIAALDTVVLSSDRPRITLAWRVALRPRQKIEEVRNVFVSLALIRSTREIYGRP